MSKNCEICHKKYSSYQSLWIHNKKFHLNNDLKNPIISSEINTNLTKKSVCSYCNKSFSTKYTLNTHYKSCSIKKYNLKNDIIDCVNTNFDTKINNKLIMSDLELEIELNKIKLEIVKKQKEIIILKLKHSI